MIYIDLIWIYKNREVYANYAIPPDPALHNFLGGENHNSFHNLPRDVILILQGLDFETTTFPL